MLDVDKYSETWRRLRVFFDQRRNELLTRLTVVNSNPRNEDVLRGRIKELDYIIAAVEEEGK